MKTYEDFYTQVAIRGQNLTTTDPRFIRVGTFFDIWLQTTFLLNRNFYKILGFLTKDDIINIYREGTERSPSLLNINQQSDLSRLGYSRGLTFSIIPEELERTVPPYGGKYNTGIPYAVSQPLPELI